jgi:hypothetical protein
MNDTQTHITALLVAHRDMIDAQARGDQAAVVDAAQRMQALRAALTAGAALPATLSDFQILQVWHSPGPWSNDEMDPIAFARAILAAAGVALPDRSQQK